MTVSIDNSGLVSVVEDLVTVECDIASKARPCGGTELAQKGTPLPNECPRRIRALARKTAEAPLPS